MMLCCYFLSMMVHRLRFILRRLVSVLLRLTFLVLVLKKGIALEGVLSSCFASHEERNYLRLHVESHRGHVNVRSWDLAGI